MSTEDELHEIVREWIEQQGFPPHSLDELIYSHDMVEPFMTDQQRLEAQLLMLKFQEL